jgi:hypothetical protein
MKQEYDGVLMMGMTQKNSTSGYNKTAENYFNGKSKLQLEVNLDQVFYATEKY